MTFHYRNGKLLKTDPTKPGEKQQTEQALDKLKNCPFCGGEAKLIENNWCVDMQFDDDHDLFFVQCSNCKASGTKVELLNAGYRKTCKQEKQEARKKAIDAWNTRLVTERLH